MSLSSGNHEVALGTTVFSNVGWCYSIPTKNYRRSFSSEISLPGDGSSRGGLGNGLRSGDRGPPHSAGLREPPDIGGARGSDRRDVVESDFAEVDFVIEPERVTSAGGEGSRDVMEEEAGGGHRATVQRDLRSGGGADLWATQLERIGGRTEGSQAKETTTASGAVESCTKDVAEKIQETVEDAAAQV